MTSQPPEFIYFDMGNVLVTFDESRAIRQMGDLAGLPEHQVREIVIDSGLQRRYHEGRVSSTEFYETFCQESGTRPDMAELEHAGSDMFELNVPIVPLVVHLYGAGYRLGILSNTCHSHWEFLRRRFRILRSYFDPVVLSHEVGSLKPEPPIYEAAIAQAGVAPERIFYLDDRPENVEAALALGIDAVQFTEVLPLAKQLSERGVRTNY
jgi:putative hydrolase of the HAD superfamily